MRPAGDEGDWQNAMTVKYVSTDRAPAAIGPYSQAVAAGGFLFASGQIPLAADGSMVEGDAAAQARQVFSNITEVLAAGGARLSDVVKATVFLVDMADFGQVNSVYEQAFAGHRPARSTVAVAALPRGAQVEIEVIALAPGER